MLKDKGIKFNILTKGQMDKKYGLQHQGYGAEVEEYKYYSLEE
jgi:hypothetical protein